MRIVTGREWKRFGDAILFPECGNDREALVQFVESLSGEETLVTSSLELIDIITERFRKGEENVLVYSDTMKSLTLKQVYELRKYLDFDVRGGFSGEEAQVSVLFVEGKTDSKFFKAVMKKLFDFRESKTAPRNLRLIERVFERDNFDLLHKKGRYVAIIPSEGNSGVVRNLGNFLKAMDVFGFSVDRIGVAIDVDEDREAAMGSIAGKLAPFNPRKAGEFYLVGNTFILPLIIGLPFEDELISWKKPAVEDLMLHLISAEGLLGKLHPALKVFEESIGRKLKPKEVMHLVLSAYGHWGNLEGFYELFVMRSRHRNIKDVLRRAGLMEGLRFLAFSER